MIYSFLYPLVGQYSFLNVFRYITFRTFGAALTALLLCMLIGPWFIQLIKKKQVGQFIREEGPKSHFSKKGTPTMGGALILFACAVSTLLWADLSNRYVWVVLLVTLCFGLIGALDDYRKVVRKRSQGLTGKEKLLFQFLVGLGAMFFLYLTRDTPAVLKFPFFKDWGFDLGWFFIPFATFVIVGSSNAVNLTDGLDGLALGPTITTSGTFLILAYCAGHIKIAEYLQIPYVPGSGELSVLCGALGASCLGFLWFNTYPAQIFMGDMGSLSLGAALGSLSVITKNELLLALCGGIFVAEALSVMTQVASFQLTGKRIFKMAPLHHHFELKGWPEPKIIVRFWIVSVLLALLTLSSLKLR